MAINPIPLKLAEIVLKWVVDKATNKLDKINFMEILEKQAPNDNQSRQICREFAQNILKTWCECLKIELDCLDLSELDIKKLGQYFTANLLIVQCKEASIYVPTKVWAEVEELMFRSSPPDSSY
jgi:hypothetical protein